MKQRRKQSMLMTVVLTLAMVFTMMPAIAWADDAAPTTDTKAYYQKVNELNDGNFVITVQDSAWKALKGASSNTDQTKVQDAVEVTVADNMITDADTLCVWTYTTSDQKFKNKQSGGSLYFSSEGLKYQDQGYRKVQYADGKLYAHSTDGTTSGKDIYVKFASGAFTTVVSDSSGAVSGEATVTLFRQVYSVQFDPKGGSGSFPAKFANTSDKVTLPAAPTPADEFSKFKGWTDGTDTYDAGAEATVSKNTIFEAKWERDESAAAELAQAKTEAKAEINKYVNDYIAYYGSEQQVAIRELVAKYEKSIDAANSKSDISTLLNQCRLEASEIPTKDVIESAKGEVDSYAEGLSKDLDEEGKKALADLVSQYKANIEKATSKTELSALFGEFKGKADAVPTAKEAEEADQKAQSVKTVTVNVKTVNAQAIDAAVKAAGGSSKYVTKIVIGKKAKKISKKAFVNYPNVKNLEVKSKKLKKSKVKGSLKGSKVTKIKVKVGNKKTNKKYVKKYKKIFTKKNAGKKVKVS